MKVALIDNMNNNFFSMTRYLRDEGIDAHLFITSSTVNSSNKHFNPANDTFKDLTKEDFIHYDGITYNIFTSLYSKSYLQLLFNKFKEFDIIIASGLSLAFLYKAGVKIDIFIPYGSDFFGLPFINKKWDLKDYLRWVIYKRFQKKSIIDNTRITIVNPNHLLMKTAIKKLNISYLNMAVPMIYNKEMYYSKEWDFLEEHDFIVFNHSRQLWKTAQGILPDFKENGGNKRNDKVIKAFARFIKITKFKKPVLILFEYGPDVEESKQLIKKLNIENNIIWLPLMPRKHVLAGLKKAHFAVDQLRDYIVGIGGASLESMAMGTPTITYTNHSTTKPNDYYYKAPFIDILKENEIFEVFKDYELNPEKYKKIGVQSEKWFNNKVGKGVIKEYIALINKIIREKNESVQ